MAPGRLSWPRGWQRHPGPREGSVRRLSATLPPLSCWISSRNRPPSPRGRGSIPPSTGSRDRPFLGKRNVDTRRRRSSLNYFEPRAKSIVLSFSVSFFYLDVDLLERFDKNDANVEKWKFETGVYELID